MFPLLIYRSRQTYSLYRAANAIFAKFGALPQRRWY